MHAAKSQNLAPPPTGRAGSGGVWVPLPAACMPMCGRVCGAHTPRVKCLHHGGAVLWVPGELLGAPSLRPLDLLGC